MLKATPTSPKQSYPLSFIIIILNALTNIIFAINLLVMF